MERINHFIPGGETHLPVPLSRYLRPLPANVLAAYIASTTEAGEIVLDPFCQSGVVVREALKAGRIAIAANFNPLPVLAVRGTLDPPDPRELDAATARLGQAPKMGVPLRDHLEQLYRTSCAHCGEEVTAEYFVWDREEGAPIEKHYHCPRCAASHTDAVEGADLDRLAGIEEKGFHYWYLVDRIAPPEDEHHALAQRLLALYTPRNLYALANLLIKIETLFADSPLQGALRLLLLRCLDACSSLNASPWDPSPPPRLRPPPRFVELNVWQAFERSYQEMRRWTRPAKLRLARTLPSLDDASTAPEAVVIRETARGLASALPEGAVKLILAAPPSPDHVFWTLSYLWSGWLFGRKGAALLKPLLRRRAARWPWYLTALRSTLRSLGQVLDPQGRLVLFLQSQVPAASEALILAAEGAGFELESLVYQPVSAAPKGLFRSVGGESRLTFVRAKEPPPPAPDPEALAAALQEEALRAAVEVLEARSEPLIFDWLHQAIYQHLSEAGLLRQATAMKEEDVSPLDFVRKHVDAALQRGLEEGPLVGLDEVSAAEGEPLHRLWWLREPRYAVEPLGDRVERAVYELLESGLPRGPSAVYPRFPGLLTPEADLVEACLASYGQEILPGQWRLRPEDRRAWRERERAEMIAHLIELGERLGYGIWLREGERGEFDPGPLGEVDVIWHEGGKAAHAFVVQWTAVLSPLLLIKGICLGEARGTFVLPEARADLVRFKLRRSSLLQRALAEGNWGFIKYRHLRRLAQVPELDRHDLKKIVGLEPIIEKPEAQIPLF